MSKEKNPLDLYEDMKAGRIKLAQKQEDSVTIKLLNQYLAILRIAYMVHQHSHWKCKGTGFYGNHLLFQRLYEDAQTRADEAAEKLIGLFGNEALDHAAQLPLMNELCEYHSDNFMENSLNVEKKFAIIAEDMYNRIKGVGEMSLGLDDMIMSHISQSETAQYLIKQNA